MEGWGMTKKEKKIMEVEMHITHLGNSTNLPEADVFFQLIDSGLVKTVNVQFRRNCETLLYSNELPS